uniref:Uncharacterized protein n=1 Tax=Physcomitrium patens TaxID=3218 RepID=A0A7I4CYQ4_PHYPA
MAHIMRLLCRGYFIEQHHLVSASSWHLSHVSSLAGHKLDRQVQFCD